MRDTVIIANNARRALWKLVAVAFALALFCSNQATDTTSATDEVSVPTNSVPPAILQLFQGQANSPPWNQDTPAETQAILQECATLQQLVADDATDDVLSNSLAASTLRISVFMTFGQSLYSTGDTRHAEMFFTSVVNDHPARATTKQVARSWLWLGKLYQNDGLASKYQQANPAQASMLFQTAATDYLTAKDASQDWVRTSGWLGAAQCYREAGLQAMCRLCLTSLLQELATNAVTLTGTDISLGPMRRDIATHLLATSFYEDGRYAEAAAVYQQLFDQVTANSTEYPGQATYLNLANAGLNWCAARLAEQSAP
jgi:tetratricopeptide (TPR) repeat protein